MKDLKVRIVINGYEVKDTGKTEVISKFAAKAGKPLTSFPIQFNGVNDLLIVEDVDDMTHSASFTLPIQNFVLNMNGLFYNQRDKSTGNIEKVIYMPADSEFAIYISDHKEAYYQIFKGYIVKYDLIDDFTVKFECENLMRFLKLSPKIKNSFPVTLEKDSIKDDTYIGSKFNLKHLIYWIFRNDKTDKLDSERNVINYYNNLIPFEKIIVIPDMLLDKLVIHNFLHPATILDKLNDSESFYFRVYVRPENFVAIGFDGVDYYTPTYNLYVGWKYYHLNEVVDVKQDIIYKKKSNPFVFSDKNSDDKTNFFEFSYPFKRGTNPIYEHNIKFEDTKKDELVVVVITENENGEVITYYYPENAKEAYELKIAQSTTDNSDTDETASKTQAPDYTRLIEDETNTIRLKIPGLSAKSARDLAKYRYDSFKDTGYSGTFVTYGFPYVRIGDIVKLHLKLYGNHDDSEYEEISYFVDRVERTFDDSGYRQTITLGNKYLTTQRREQISLSAV